MSRLPLEYNSEALPLEPTSLPYAEEYVYLFAHIYKNYFRFTELLAPLNENGSPA
jgi:hypothetical protein